MEALDDDKLPAEDRIENAKENATETLKNLADQAQWRAQEGRLLEPPRWRSDVDTAH